MLTNLSSGTVPHEPYGMLSFIHPTTRRIADEPRIEQYASWQWSFPP